MVKTHQYWWKDGSNPSLFFFVQAIFLFKEGDCMNYTRCFILFTDNTEIIYDNIIKLDRRDDYFKLINEYGEISMVIAKNVKTIGFLPYLKKGVK